jgi:hypothetical protein
MFTALVIAGTILYCDRSYPANISLEKSKYESKPKKFSPVIFCRCAVCNHNIVIAE